MPRIFRAQERRVGHALQDQAKEAQPGTGEQFQAAHFLPPAMTSGRIARLPAAIALAIGRAVLANLLAQLLALFGTHAPAAIVRTTVLALLLRRRLLLLAFHPSAAEASTSTAATKAAATATRAGEAAAASTAAAMKRPGHGGARADEHRHACRCEYGDR
ncbi:MAG TPA: hypothetical protein VGN52_08245 [Burkholderiales bacterium]